MTEKDLQELRIRNEERVANAIRNMGTKYACHAANLVKRDPVRARFMPAEQLKVAIAPLVLLRRGGNK